MLDLFRKGFYRNSASGEPWSQLPDMDGITVCLDGVGDEVGEETGGSSGLASASG